MANIFENLPADFSTEHVIDLVKAENVRIERIISLGQTSPETGWYDQTENEWVMVLEGSGTILFEDGHEQILSKGDFINIPAHVKHKVSRTDPDKMTIWLAVFYK